MSQREAQAIIQEHVQVHGMYIRWLASGGRLCVEAEVLKVQLCRQLQRDQAMSPTGMSATASDLATMLKRATRQELQLMQCPSQLNHLGH